MTASDGMSRCVREVPTGVRARNPPAAFKTLQKQKAWDTADIPMEQASGTAYVTVGSRTVNIIQPGMADTPDRRFVRFAYFQALRRLPDAPEEGFHVASLASGLSRASMMRNFLEGVEFRNGGTFVSGLYVVLLGRAPERSGWAFQLHAVSQPGMTQDKLAEAFVQ